MNYIKMWGEEDHNYFDLEPSLLNYGPKASKKFGYGIKEAFMFGKGFHAEFYLSEEEIKRNYEEGYNFFINKDNFLRLLEEIKVAIGDLVEKMKVLVNTDLSKLNNLELIQLYGAYGGRLGNIFVVYSMTQPHKVPKLEEELINFLKERKIEDIYNSLSILTLPKTRFVFTSSGDGFFKSFSELIQKEDAKIDKTLLNKEIAIEQKQELSEKKKLLNKLKAPERIVYICEVLSALAEERMRMRFTWMKALYYNELFLTEMKTRFKMQKKILRMYDDSEFEPLILEGKKLTKEILNLRKKGFIKILNYNNIETLEGSKAEQFMKKINSSKKNVTEIIGMVASKGKVVGRVTLFSYKKAGEHSKKIKEMEMGNVVVTEMTRPNIIPACEKAGAIVTDEGGVLSHAAIVSRELQIPCVIGTKIATLILKDGDYVEVDAEKGIVRKIGIKEYQSKKIDFKSREIKSDKNEGLKLNKIKKNEILWFSDIDKRDIPSVGGKGANLGELYKFIEVPAGFCISVSAYKNILNKDNLKSKIKKLLSKIDIGDNQTLKEKSEKIKDLILNTKIDDKLKNNILKNYKKLASKKVAVRSSATAEDLPNASFAGQQDTYLNITNEKELISAVKKCWASLFNERAIYYREKNRFNHLDVSISVIVQEMIDPDFAGVMFTKDPIEKKDLLIEVVKGLGEQLVSGEITPSSYLLDKNTLKIVKKQEKFKLNPKFLESIANAGKKIESHYKSPQDVEWAIDKKGNLFILQSRAITTI